MCRNLPKVIHFTREVGVPKGAVAFATAPEDVACAFQLVGDLDCLLHLRGGIREDVGAAAFLDTVDIV